MANTNSSHDFRFFMHESIADEVKAILKNGIVKKEIILSRATIFQSDANQFFHDSNLKWKESGVYSIVMAPGNWLKKPFQVPADIQSRIAQGSMRLVFWNVDGEPKNCTAPATFIPAMSESSERGALLKAMILSHVYRLPSWGVQTLLPPKSKILTERINNEKQIARKIEQSLAFICKNNPAFANQGLPLRLAMTASFSAALASNLPSPGQKPPVFQIGQCEDLVVFSLRWKNSNFDLNSWKTPDLRWQAIFHESLGGAVQFSAESQETEVLLAFSTKSEKAERTLWLQNHPLIFDVLTTERLKLAAALPNETEAYAFDYFEVEDKRDDPIEFITPNPELVATAGAFVIQKKDVAAKENFQLELTGLRVEYQKIEKQIKNSQDQMSEMTRKMSQAFEAEKTAQAQIKMLTTQIEKMKTASVNQTAQGAQELNTIKTRLENAKLKELELGKKLTQALDQIKQMKSGQQKVS
jgi:hypothetical protein